MPSPERPHPRDAFASAPAPAPAPARARARAPASASPDLVERLGGAALGLFLGAVLGSAAWLAMFAWAGTPPAAGRVIGASIASATLGGFASPLLAIGVLELTLHFLGGLFTGLGAASGEPGSSVPPALRVPVLRLMMWLGLVVGLALTLARWWWLD